MLIKNITKNKRMSIWGLKYEADLFTGKVLGKFKISGKYFSHQQIVYRWVKSRYRKLAKSIQSNGDAKRRQNIWVIWWQGYDAMPTLVKHCYDSILRNSKGFKVILIDKDNYQKYITVPDFIIEKQKRGFISFAAFSDYIRFKLLREYGGWYCDATIYATQPFEPLPAIYSAKSIKDARFISESRWSAFLWYFPWEGDALAKFIVAALEEYWSKYDSIIDYFLIDHLIRLFYETNISFHKDIDSLIIDNPDLYFFQSPQAQENYHIDNWVNIMGRNRFFKCNWRTFSSNKNSYFYKLLGQ